ncbi:MAG TPA: hypothetical protein VK611_02835 [Acidimicrobiales bacterium]|nr:hypothetical protein [Acidimicrobiales bacterium]
MEPVTRRSFLVTGSVGAAGAATAFGTGWALSAANDNEAALSQDEIDDLNGPLVVQLTNAAAGELEVLVGEREVTFTDKALAARLLRAAKS